MEELKLILDALTNLGESGKTAFIWWLLADKVLYVLSWLLTFGGLLWVAMRFIGILNVIRAFKELHFILGFGSCYPVDIEIKRVINRVKELQERAKNV